MTAACVVYRAIQAIFCILYKIMTTQKQIYFHTIKNCISPNRKGYSNKQPSLYHIHMKLDIMQGKKYALVKVTVDPG